MQVAAPQPRRDISEVRHHAEGQAAMMLLESLLMVLIDRSVLTKADVLETIELVIETKKNIAAEGGSVDVETAASGLLVTLTNSLMASKSL